MDNFFNLIVRRGRLIAALSLLAASAVSGCSSGTQSTHATYNPSRIATATAAPNTPVSGVAAWNGDISSPGLTAAHRALPIGSFARVTNLQTGQAAVVQVNSRTSLGADRDIDLSRDAAAQIGALQDGVATVLIEPVAAPSQTYAYQTANVYIPPAATTYSPPTARYPTAAANNGVDYDPNLATASIPAYQPPVHTAPPAYHASPPAYNVNTVSAPATHSSQRFIQLGSYQDHSNALKKVEKLRSQGMSQGYFGQAAIEQAVVNGRIHHRVRLGPMANAALANQALSEALRLGHSGARIIQ